ncbi:hepatitis A virus cellular receptor 1 homolog isoform X2 [Hyperolius riggenbachi]|uniref:hepatitis A virus cellular receptor 1 homolog isoform X2 n=1 Tax=Hyperolius riggenbachi TaxID=752182 RepID=UPI0035A26E9F
MKVFITAIRNYRMISYTCDHLSTALEVRGMLGGAVTLPCSYSVEEYGETPMCWRREQCDIHFICIYEIISTDGSREIGGESHRYRLLGDITQGDVSLTITDVTMEDQGPYCCKVGLPGWFNDQKHEFTLTVHEGGDVLDHFTSTEVTTTQIMETTAVFKCSVIFLFFRISALILFILTSAILSSLLWESSSCENGCSGRCKKSTNE